MSSKIDSVSSPRLGILVGATVALAAILRLVGLESGLWYDEIVTLVLSARHPLRQILTEFPGMNAHPLYSVLAHASIVTFGESAWALRLPACLFGVASVVMTYRLGVPLVGRAEAWVATALLTTSYHHIWFSQNARGYTLLGFLTLLSTHVLLRAVRTGRPRDYAVYAIACAAGIYAHLTMAFVVTGHVAVALVGRLIGWRPSRDVSLGAIVRASAAAGALSAIAYAPFAAGVMGVVGASDPPDTARVATARWALGEAARALFSGPGALAAAAGVAFAGIGAVSLSRRQPLASALCIVPGVVTLAVMVALGQPIRPRFFFFLSGAAAIFVGRGVGAVVSGLSPGWSSRAPHRSPIPSTAGVVALGVALSAASAVALPRNYLVPKQDFGAATRFLASAETQGAQIVVADPACLPFEAYYGQTWQCLGRHEEWGQLAQAPHRVLVAYTLADYVGDARLRDDLATRCPVVRRFAGTLADGDITVCEVAKAGP